MSTYDPHGQEQSGRSESKQYNTETVSESEFTDDRVKYTVKIAGGVAESIRHSLRKDNLTLRNSYDIFNSNVYRPLAGLVGHAPSLQDFARPTIRGLVKSYRHDMTTDPANGGYAPTESKSTGLDNEDIGGTRDLSAFVDGIHEDLVERFAGDSLHVDHDAGKLTETREASVGPLHDPDRLGPEDLPGVLMREGYLEFVGEEPEETIIASRSTNLEDAR